MTIPIFVEHVPDAQRTRQVTMHVRLARVARRAIGVFCTDRTRKAAIAEGAVRTRRAGGRTRIGPDRVRAGPVRQTCVDRAIEVIIAVDIARAASRRLPRIHLRTGIAGIRR